MVSIRRAQVDVAKKAYIKERQSEQRNSNESGNHCSRQKSVRFKRA